MEDRRSKIERQGKLSAVGVDGLEFAVEEGLKEIGGDEGVELALLFRAGEFFAGAFAGGELLLGFEGAEALIDEEKFNTRACGQMAAPVDGFLAAGPRESSMFRGRPRTTLLTPSAAMRRMMGSKASVEN